FIPCWASKSRTYRDVESGVRPESAFRRREPPEPAFRRSGLGATGVGFPLERAWCDRSRLSAGAGLVRPESAFRRSGLPHMSEVGCELGFVEVMLPQTCLMTSCESMTHCRHPADAGTCRVSS